MVLAAIIGCIEGLVIIIRDGIPDKKDDVIPYIKDDYIRDRYISRYDLTIAEPVQVPEYMRDTIQALEFSADISRREAVLYRHQASSTMDPVKAIALQKKEAAALKRLAADNQKIMTLKDTYGIM